MLATIGNLLGRIDSRGFVTIQSLMRFMME